MASPPRLIHSYLLAGDIDRHSERTIEARRDLLGRLVWFLTGEDAPGGVHELRLFLHHVRHGHEEAPGRWGNPRNRRPTTARTTKNYHGILRAFFNWCVAEGALGASPMDRIPVPIDRPDQIQSSPTAKCVGCSTPRRRPCALPVASGLSALRIGDVDPQMGMSQCGARACPVRLPSPR